jgi:hypothetical protein
LRFNCIILSIIRKMKIKVIKRAEKDGRITGVFNYGSLGGIMEATVDMGTVKQADNYDEFSQKIEECLLKAAPAISQTIEESKIPVFEKKNKSVWGIYYRTNSD